jgi:hypothetical protein
MRVYPSRNALASEQFINEVAEPFIYWNIHKFRERGEVSLNERRG